MFDRNPPSQSEIERWFLANPPVPPRTFEFALVLGGTVSAGAYTAGALDFLIEALDSWTQLRDANNSAAPRHNVVLRVITGTSGGGVCAAIAGRGLAFAFDPIARSTPVGAGLTGNPFYDTWIKTLTLDRFLNTSDIGKEVTSLLNGAAIDAGARNIIEFSGKGPQRRSWVAGPLRIILTLTNLRGVPFRLDFDGDRSESYVDHADYIRYALVYPNQPIQDFRPDELVLGLDGERLPQASTWDEFSQFARATAAFPAGFPPRPLVRPTAQYRYRVVLRAPTDPAAAFTAEPSYSVLLPDWPALIPDGCQRCPRRLPLPGGRRRHDRQRADRIGSHRTVRHQWQQSARRPRGKSRRPVDRPVRGQKPAGSSGDDEFCPHPRRYLKRGYPADSLQFARSGARRRRSGVQPLYADPAARD